MISYKTPTPTYDGTGSPTPTATTIPTEPTLEPLQHAWYAYDGDGREAPVERSGRGNMVKRIVNSTITFYPGRHFNKEVTTTGTKIQKFYFAIGQTIAVRTLQDSNDTLQWILSDHLGSASTTANQDGTWNSTKQYTAFGEIRNTLGITPTKYRYTGQLAQAELGLDFYVARWYDPLTGHFTQADTIIPEPGKAPGFDRYSYVNNNPVRYNDPSGHGVDCGIGEPGCDHRDDLRRWKDLRKQHPLHPPNNSNNGRKYNGEKVANWAINNQKVIMSKEDKCYTEFGGTSCTCFASKAIINQGFGYEFVKIGSNEFSRTPDLLGFLKAKNIPFKEFEDHLVSPEPYNMSSIGWKDFLKNNMPQEGDIILFHNANQFDEYNHVAIIVGFNEESRPLVVDQAGANPNQPHPIDDTPSTDIWNVMIFYLNKWDGE